MTTFSFSDIAISDYLPSGNRFKKGESVSLNTTNKKMNFCEPSVTKEGKVSDTLAKNLPLDNVPHVLPGEVPPVSCFDLTKKEF
jgi:hypothetical protein